MRLSATRVGRWCTLVGAAIALVPTGCANLEDRVEELEVSDPDLAAIEDGIYEGSHRMFPIWVILDVRVSDHEIAEITIDRHFNGQGGQAEAILDEILAAQSLQVNAISGATYSSMVILKAVENALAPAEDGNS